MMRGFQFNTRRRLADPARSGPDPDAPPVRRPDNIDTVNVALGNRNLMRFLGEHVRPGAPRDARAVPPGAPAPAPVQMMPVKEKKKKMSAEELRQKKAEQAARLGAGKPAKGKKGRATGPGNRDEMLHALGTERSLSPSGLGRSVEEMAPPPGNVRSLRDLAAAASVSDITDVDTAFSSAQTAIDRLMEGLDMELTQAITDPFRAAGQSKKTARPKKSAAPEQPGTLGMTPEDTSRLRVLAADSGLRQVLEAAELLGYEVGSLNGQICLVVGGMTYAIEGQTDILHRLFFDDSKHVVFGWCVGNKRHNKPEALARTLAAHRPLLGRRMSVHDAAYQADWNPDIIQRHFGETADPGKVAKCASNRVDDAASYVAQARAEGAAFDEMIKMTVPGKEAHVREFTEDITGILEDFKASPEITELLRQRVPLMEDFARHIRHPAHRRAALDRQLEEFHRQARRMYGEGTDRARRAELACHSMSVLEGIAADCIRQDPDTMQRLFGSGPAGAGAGQEFYQRLYRAMGDYKSTKYMGAQEYEFERFAVAHDLIYVYSAEAGPFLTGASRPYVSVLIGKPLNATGVPISSVLPGLGTSREHNT